jgi:hypothetical protein
VKWQTYIYIYFSIVQFWVYEGHCCWLSLKWDSSATHSVAFLTNADKVPTIALHINPPSKVYRLPLTSANTPDSSPLNNIPAKWAPAIAAPRFAKSASSVSLASIYQSFFTEYRIQIQVDTVRHSFSFTWMHLMTTHIFLKSLRT